ncbi:AbrB/MazE/SpoVT family DNA-binding domain-containing protein [Burkholderia sp. BCC0801]|uniref:AbrB/MazE/SpoVT family DNA-binding domain-containing protein n=1 Tax=unclassified Burkholderia TaxID=2613784 RepID=UPI001FC87674|nr:AbrB/MazE/SpoVT family DNA-binding domain-containing protein [Burkholderia sp. BCC0801]
MQIAKWGTGLAVRLPAGLVDALGLREGDEVQVVVRRAGALAESPTRTPKCFCCS